MITNSSTVYEFEEFILDEFQKRLYFRETEIKLSQKNYEILLVLVKNADSIIAKQQFHDQVWRDVFVEDGNLAVSINTLRKTFKLYSETVFIETYARRGYKFCIPVSAIDYDPIHLSTSTITTVEPLTLAPQSKSLVSKRSLFLFIFLGFMTVLLITVLVFALR